MESRNTVDEPYAEAGVEPARNFMDRVIRNNELKEIVEDVVVGHDLLSDMNIKVNKSCQALDKMGNRWMLMAIKAADNHNMPEEELKKYLDWLEDRISIYNDRRFSPHPTGQDLINMGLTPGPEFTEILAEAHRQILNGETKDVILKNIEKKYCAVEQDKDIEKERKISNVIKNMHSRSNKNSQQQLVNKPKM